MAGLLARGSQPCAAFPVTQWRYDARLTAYSCGGSYGLGPRISPRWPAPYSLLIPRRGTIAAMIRGFAVARQADFAELRREIGEIRQLLEKRTERS